MTVHRYLNVGGLGGNYVMWWLRKVMMDAGWTITGNGSGTGGIFHATSDIFDPVDNPKVESAAVVGVGVGQEHFGNVSCWWALADPAGNREVCFQRTTIVTTTYDTRWSFTYSPAAGFTGGDEDTRATATDEQVVRSISNDWFQSGNSLDLIHVAADDVPSARGEYGFAAIDIVGTNDVEAFVALDDMYETAVGDTSALTLWAHGKNHGDFDVNIIGDLSYTGALTVIDDGGFGEAWGNVYSPFPSNTGNVGPQDWALNSRYDSKDRIFPVGLFSRSHGAGFLGYSRWLKHPSVGRGYPNTADNKKYIYAKDYLVDMWDGSTNPNSI